MQHSPNAVKAYRSKRSVELASIIDPARILNRRIDVVAFASDASFYRLIPEAVVLARDIAEIQGLFRFSHQHDVPLTFRAAGTSLSGQSVTDGILVEVARHWRGISVEDGGRKIRVQPGVIGSQANLLLKEFGTRIGPDPASIDACMMGGILANNSSGMCCEVSENAYHTLRSLKFVLPSGTVIDTADPTAAAQFREHEPQLSDGLAALKAEVESDARLMARIRAKYARKNTTGYSLNALVDFDTPLDIFQHLLIGSEGTLAFIAEAVLNTVPSLPVKYTGLLLFSDLYSACAAIVALRTAGAKAVELMDNVSLRSVSCHEVTLSWLRELPEGAAALLVEFQAADEQDRAELEARAQAAIRGLSTLACSPPFTHDATEQALLWKVRKGLFPTVGAIRRGGTTVIIEDVVFPVERLADAVIELRKVLARHGYEEAIIFGHAKEGNLHFVIAQSFDTRSAIDQYARLIDEIVRLVVRHEGALKGEHGTGRNMAPFVEAEWGTQAYAVMKRIKSLVDPRNLLNPGVIINSDSKAHIQNLKDLPRVEDEIDKCIECGYCERHCPSRNLTLTPRQRIVVWREMARARSCESARSEAVRSLEADFSYAFLDTCATDGLCSLACPVGIDTGSLTKKLRGARHSPTARAAAQFLARNLSVVERCVRFSLRAGRVAQWAFGRSFVSRLPLLARKLMGNCIPLWTGDAPHAAEVCRPVGAAAKAQAVLFPSCITRTMGRLPGEPAGLSPTEAAIEVARRAGVSLLVPRGLAGTCCGVPFSSKGYDEAGKFVVNRAIERFWHWSGNGRLPVIVDITPCTHGLLNCRNQLSMENKLKYDALRIIDSISFVHGELLPRLTFPRRLQRVALHPVCSAVKMGIAWKLEEIAQACSQCVLVPSNAGCCGFAGDRGFLVPELTESATAQEAAEVRAVACDGYFSTSRMCEVAMSRASGRPYRSYFHLLEETTRP